MDPKNESSPAADPRVALAQQDVCTALGERDVQILMLLKIIKLKDEELVALRKLLADK